MPAPDVIRLRKLLKDALATADDLGDDARVEPDGAGYLADAETSGIAKAIETIAACTGEITMFVGAGVSMEAELPSWDELVRKLLVQTRDPGEKQEAIEAWSEMVLKEGALAAAAVAESLYADDDDFKRALRKAMYTRAPNTYVPGALAGQIAWLKKQIGSRLTILTVNYDGLLEAALEKHKLSPVSHVQADTEPQGKAAVWHLHGRLIPATSGKGWRDEGNLVLSEGSYVRSTERGFPQEFVAKRLKRSLCVFVGLSMTDPNFIRWLYRSTGKTGGPRFVIFVRQASSVPERKVRQLLEESAAERWSRCEVTPVWANYYGEVAQIVHEIGLRCTGKRPVDFSKRAKARLEYGAARLTPRSAVKFAAAQREYSEWLRQRVESVRKICAAEKSPVDLSKHDLALGLWAVDHAKGKIMNWVSSDRAYQEPGSVMGNPLHADSRWVAAAAIANGVSVEKDPNVYASRWRFIRAIPIVVEPEGERSVVGALTLTSTTPPERFPLARATAPPGLLKGIDDFLVEETCQFFLP